MAQEERQVDERPLSSIDQLEQIFLDKSIGKHEQHTRLAFLNSFCLSADFLIKFIYIQTTSDDNTNIDKKRKLSDQKKTRKLHCSRYAQSLYLLLFALFLLLTRRLLLK